MAMAWQAWAKTTKDNRLLYGQLPSAYDAAARSSSRLPTRAAAAGPSSSSASSTFGFTRFDEHPPILRKTADECAFDCCSLSSYPRRRKMSQRSL